MIDTGPTATLRGESLAERALQAAIAIFVSFLLFMVIPLAQSLFKTELGNEKNKNPGQQIEINLSMRKEPKRQVQQQIRRVSSSEGRSQASRSLNFKFAPDLGLGEGSGVGIESSNLQNMVFEEGETEEPAIPLAQEIPDIPSRARDMGIGGTAELILIIDRGGKVSRIDFVRIPHPVYKEAIQATLRRWRFKPARHKGVPVQVKMRQVIDFRLE